MNFFVKAYWQHLLNQNKMKKVNLLSVLFTISGTMMTDFDE